MNIFVRCISKEHNALCPVMMNHRVPLPKQQRRNVLNSLKSMYIHNDGN